MTVIQKAPSVVVRQSKSSVVVVRTKPVPAVVVKTAIPGPPGKDGSAKLYTVGAVPLSGHCMVAVDADGTLRAADATRLSDLHAVIGMTDSAFAAGVPAAVLRNEVIEFAGWNFPPGAILVLGTNGQPALTPPAGANFYQSIGRALTSTRVLISLSPPIAIN